MTSGFINLILVHHGRKKSTIPKVAKAENISFLTFDFQGSSTSFGQTGFLLLTSKPPTWSEQSLQ
ncbi:hypothetical protein H6G41_12350 [Tolypothrix sp. FACHB-123]|uniref:hypothetical protein n=1 Tax=Tolypothrix sp. FACHB-123 TaxID=2692868 RepID=UPI0016880725|nr:hypothetical protein [Tolypothrix sp. FACHB-123]MBD2355399.1 hypothetical protein [Tolypothrix sp. FACHB-123]